MQDPIIVRNRWHVDELVQAQRLHMRNGVQRVLWPTFHVLFGLTFALSVLLVVVERPSTFAGLGVGLGVYWFLMWFGIRPFLVRWQFKKRPDNGLEVTWSITEEALESTSDQHTARFTWAMIAKAVEGPKGMLLYLNSRMFHWLPRHGFESEEAWRAFGALVRQQVETVFEVGKG